MKVSASRLVVLEHCQWWARDTSDADPDRPSEPADTGKRFHSLADCELEGGTPESFALQDDTRAQKLMGGWRKWWPTFHRDRWFRSEVPMLYDWQTGRVREMPRGWANGPREREATEIPAIIDLLAADDSGVIGVWDYKTGKSKSGDPSQSWQLLLCALAAVRRYGATGAVTGFIYPRSRDPFIVEQTELTTLDLFDFEQGLQSRMRHRNEAEPNRGDWCFRCGTRLACPALRTDLTDYNPGQVPPWMGDVANG